MSTIAAGTSAGSGLVHTSDTSGSLVFQTNNNVTALSMDTSGNATFPGNMTLSGYTEGLATASTGTAFAIDVATSTVKVLTLTGNCTFTFPTLVAGKSFTLLLKQDATGGRTVTWPATVKWPAATAPTITATANRTDKYTFVCDGSFWLGSSAGQNYA